MMGDVMPRKPTLILPPLDLGSETLGERIARLRKEKGYRQAELARKIGITQGMAAEYESGRIRPHPEMTVRFALALEVSADELLGLKRSDNQGEKPDLKILRRLRQIEQLPAYEQRVLLKTIDNFLKGAEK